MKRVLLIGTVNRTVQDLYDMLSQHFQVEFCLPDTKLIDATVDIVNPTATLLVKSEDIPYSIYTELIAKKTDGSCITVCTADDEQAKKYEGDNRFYFLKPSGNEDLVRMLDDVSIPVDNRVKNILAIDDTALVLRTLKGILDKEYNIFPVTTVSRAMKIIENNDIDLIILDYEMPDIDGHSAMKMFRESVYTKNTPIVFLTAVADKDRIAEVAALNPEAYMLKPLDAEKITEMVKKIIG